MTGDVVEVSGQSIAAGPRRASNPLTLLLLEQPLLPLEELGLVAQRLVQPLTPQQVLRRYHYQEIALHQSRRH